MNDFNSIRIELFTVIELIILLFRVFPVIQSLLLL